MERKKLSERAWYPYAVAGCIAVAFYVLLTHLNMVLNALSVFAGYFKAVILGCVLAYLVNPLANWYANGLFKKMRNVKIRWTLSVLLAALSALILLTVLLGTLIPQFVNSIVTFADHFDEYRASLQNVLENSGLQLTGTLLDPERFSTLSENAMTVVSSFLTENAARILGTTASIGKGIFTWVIAIVLSLYLLSAKEAAKTGGTRFLRALLRPKRAKNVIVFLKRCDSILVSFIVHSLMESLIVGVVNAIFMLLLGMQYVSLISVVVGVTNLIPTFGPVIGGVTGAFILLLVNPFHALMFILFTFVLQFADGYIVKPKLFGDSLGVSGLLILIAGIVFGNMFGIIGVLLAIPSAAILNFIYHDYLLPALENRK